MANLNKNPTALTLARMAAGLTRTDLAEKTGISDRTIERWEQRRSDIGNAEAESILKIATALNCNVADLFDNAPVVSMQKKYNRDKAPAQKKETDTNLKYYRLQAGLSVSELARMSGVKEHAIASYEVGRNNINEARTNFVFALSLALGVSFGKLLE